MDHGLLLTCTDQIPSGRSGHGSSSWNVRFVTEPLQPRGLLRPVYELSPRSIPNSRAGSDLPHTYQVSGFESILGYRLALEGPTPSHCMDNHDHNPGHFPVWSFRDVFLLVRSALYLAFTVIPDYGDGCWLPFVSFWGPTPWTQRPPLFNRLPWPG